MSELNDVLERVSLYVLEDWALMMPEIAGAPQFRPDLPYYLAEMEFCGERNYVGRISILCQLSFMELLTRNLIGADADDPVDANQCLDALREMANVLTGHFVTEAFGVDEPFELRSPGARPATAQEAQNFVARYCLVFLGDDEPVVITYNVPSQE